MFRQKIFFEDNALGEVMGLAGLMFSVRTVMKRVAGNDIRYRKLLVGRINEVAKREGVSLNSCGIDDINLETLDRWLQATDRYHEPSIEAIICFCLAAGDTSPVKPLLNKLKLVGRYSKTSISWCSY